MAEIEKIKSIFGISESRSSTEPSKLFFETVIGRKLLGVQKCPLTSPHLLGPLVVKHENVPKLEPGSKSFVDHYGSVQKGGASRPEECEARQKVAIIVPYR